MICLSFFSRLESVSAWVFALEFFFEMPETVYNLVFQDNVVCLPAKLAHQLGGMGQICVVYKVTSLLHLIDPNSCQCEWKKHTEICCAMKLAWISLFFCSHGNTSGRVLQIPFRQLAPAQKPRGVHRDEHRGHSRTREKKILRTGSRIKKGRIVFIIHTSMLFWGRFSAAIFN